tara:strand:+ start:510 stop:1379 length:870 start_codon:yes stop_codon:yes gene_type:complete
LLLKENSIKLKKNLTGRKLRENEIIKELSDCVGVIAGTESYTKDVIDALPNLKVISRLGVGTDNINLDFSYSKGIKIFTTKTRPSDAVAELVLALILNYYRKINISNSYLRKGIWKKLSGPLLKNKTIGIVGLGHIGKQLALLLSGFNCNLLAYDKSQDKEFANKNNIHFVDIDELIKQSDIISLHLDLNKNTHFFINKEKLDQMKSNCLLVNASRGEIIDENALYQSLENNKIMGACLDVFNNEPYNGPLLELDNVLLTPHIGSYANEIRIKMELDATKNLIKGLLSE